MDQSSFIRPGNFDLFNVKITQIQMMIDRGYNIPESEKAMLNMTKEQFISYLEKLVTGEVDNEWVPYLDSINFPESSKYTERTLLGNVYSKRDENDKRDKRCMVIFVDQDGGQQVIKIIADAIVVIVEGIETGIKYDELILVSKIPFSTVSKKCISDLRYTDHWVFFDKELIFNVSKHVYVPKHTLMSREESIVIKKIYKHMEQISEDDPVVKYYGWKVGGVVLIERDVSDLDMMIDKYIAKRVIVRTTAVVNKGKSGKK